MRKLFSYGGRHLHRPHPGARFLSVLSLVFLAAFLTFSAMALKDYLQMRWEQDAFVQLAETVRQAEVVAETAEPEEPSTHMGQTERHDNTGAAAPSASETAYAALAEENPDFAAWLTVGGTEIDYPVMYTPEEPEYYLRRAFDGSSSYSGTPFLGEGCNLESDCLIVYGHNMKNDTMFGALGNYADTDFQTAHPTLTLTTAQEVRTYEIFAAVETRILYTDEAGYRYYDHAGDLTEADFTALVDWLKDTALYDTGVTPSYGEQLLILSTCSYQAENGRFLVAARRTGR